MTAKRRLYRDGLLSGCSVAGWMLATVGIVHYTAVWTAGWELSHRALAFAVAGAVILGLALAAASVVYLTSLRGPPEHMTGGGE